MAIAAFYHIGQRPKVSLGTGCSTLAAIVSLNWGTPCVRERALASVCVCVWPLIFLVFVIKSFVPTTRLH